MTASKGSRIQYYCNDYGYAVCIDTLISTSLCQIDEGITLASGWLGLHLFFFFLQSASLSQWYWYSFPSNYRKPQNAEQKLTVVSCSQCQYVLNVDQSRYNDGTLTCLALKSVYIYPDIYISPFYPKMVYNISKSTTVINSQANFVVCRANVNTSLWPGHVIFLFVGYERFL